MATINVTNSSAGYVPIGSVYGVGIGVPGTAATAQTTANNLATVGSLHSIAAHQLSVYHVTAVANAETITTPIHNAIACAWQPEDIGDDGDTSVLLTVPTSDAGFRSRFGSTFTFSNGGTRQGWLWVLSGT